MSEKKYYVFCASNCRYEGMTKEQILSAIMQAVESGEIHDVDAGFITRLQEQNAKRAVTLWVGTRAQYNAIEKPAENCLYVITDDTTAADYEKAIDDLRRENEEIKKTMRALLQDIEDHKTKSAVTDFSESVDIPSAAEHLIFVESKNFAYDAAAGIVHFSIMLRYERDLISGTFSAAIELGAHKPKAGRFPLTISERMQYGGSQQLRGDIGYPWIGDDTCDISIFNGSEIKAGDRLLISGWYFS